MDGVPESKTRRSAFPRSICEPIPLLLCLVDGGSRRHPKQDRPRRSHGDKNLYDLPAEELAAIPTVCGSLREALDELRSGMDFLLAGDVFTKDQIEAYIALKMEEVERYEHTPHPVEYAMYYSC